jgi:hypothetical protein
VSSQIDKYLVARYFPIDARQGFVPYEFQTDLVYQLPLTELVDKEAWEVTKSTDRQHQTLNDLPANAWDADLDQPALEIAELGSRLTAEFQELEKAVFQRDTAHVEHVLERVKVQVRAIEGLAKVQREAIRAIEDD